MSFITAAIIGGVASLAGGAMAAKSQKRGAEIAAAGSERELEFARESRELARADVAPYRAAGVTALDALMSMTGLKGTGGAVAPPRPAGDYGFQMGRQGAAGAARPSKRVSAYGPSTQLRNEGGPIEQDTIYNVHELGPENIYADGAVTRGKGPATIDGETGYVEPNIEGRVYGGEMQPRTMVPPTMRGGVGYGGPQPVIPGGTPPPPTAVNPGIAAGGVMENPGGVEGGYNFMTDPGYEFRREEGMRGLERGAAARGGLLSGGFGRRAIRYGQDYASGEYQNVYNRIANIAGLGQVASGQAGGYAMAGGAQMGRAASEGALAGAYGQIGAGSAWAGAANQMAQLPWDKAFSGGGGGTATPPVYDFQGRRIQY